AWAAPAANTATAPTQVVSRKLRIGILPATVPRVTDARAHAVLAGRHPFNGETSGSGSQRHGGVGGMARPAYEHTSGFPGPTYLKPEAARSLFPRLIDCNHHFWRLLSQPCLTPPSLSTRRRISSVSCANEVFHDERPQPGAQAASAPDALATWVA